MVDIQQRGKDCSIISRQKKVLTNSNKAKEDRAKKIFSTFHYRLIFMFFLFYFFIFILDLDSVNFQ